MKAEDLKNSILQMAMEGKLVPQDSDDEPASVLLDKIKEEKEKLIKEKKIKRNNKESFIFRKDNHFYEKIGKKGEAVCIDDEIPWDIPNSWEWCRLGNLISIITGVSYKKGDIGLEGIRVLRGGNIQDTNVLLLDDDVFLPESYYDPIKEIRKGDVLIVASTGSKKVIGKPGFVKENYENVFIGAFLRICRPINNYLSEYIQLIFASEYYRNHIRTLSQGTNINNVKKEYLENLFVPLPPLKEQEIILTKLDELLPLIEEFMWNQEKLETLNNEFSKQIKDSILQYAIQGKLVPQDPNDEPASILLGKIKEEKEQLIKEKKIKRNKNESFIFKENNHFYEKIGNKKPICIDNEIPFNIPKTWEWCRLNTICIKLTDGSHNPPPKKESGIPVLSVKNINNGEIDFNTIYRFTDKDGFEKENPRTNIQKEDIILGIVGSIGEVAIYNSDKKVIAQRSISIIKTKIFNKFLKYVFESNLFKEYASKNSKGTAQRGLYLKTLKEFLIPIPPFNEQLLIVQKIEELFEELEF